MAAMHRITPHLITQYYILYSMLVLVAMLTMHDGCCIWCAVWHRHYYASSLQQQYYWSPIPHLSVQYHIPEQTSQQLAISAQTIICILVASYYVFTCLRYVRPQLHTTDRGDYIIMRCAEGPSHASHAKQAGRSLVVARSSQPFTSPAIQAVQSAKCILASYYQYASIQQLCSHIYMHQPCMVRIASYHSMVAGCVRNYPGQVEIEHKERNHII